MCHDDNNSFIIIIREHEYKVIKLPQLLILVLLSSYFIYVLIHNLSLSRLTVFSWYGHSDFCYLSYSDADMVLLVTSH